MKLIAVVLISLSMWLHAPETDPFERHRRGQEHARQGNDEQTLVEYLWCLEHGPAHDDKYRIQRKATLLPDIIALAKKYQPALDALHDRLNATEATILGGSYSWSDTDDFITLCDALHESQRAIAVLDRLDRDDLKQRSIRHAVVIQFADELVAQQRYEAIIEIMDDVAVWVARQRQDILDMVKLVEEKSDAGDLVRRTLVQVSVRGRIPYYEALLASEELANAAQLADILIECDPRAEVFQALADACRRAGKGDLADEFERRAAHTEDTAAKPVAATQPK